MENLRKFNIGVCEGRHEMPQVTDGFVFGQEVNPLDVIGLEEQAENFVTSLVTEKDRCEINIYATGLTVALLAIVKTACHHCAKVIVMHYDRNSNSYYPQVVQDFTAQGK